MELKDLETTIQMVSQNKEIEAKMFGRKLGTPSATVDAPVLVNNRFWQ